MPLTMRVILAALVLQSGISLGQDVEANPPQQQPPPPQYEQHHQPQPQPPPPPPPQYEQHPPPQYEQHQPPPQPPPQYEQHHQPPQQQPPPPQYEQHHQPPQQQPPPPPQYEQHHQPPQQQPAPPQYEQQHQPPPPQQQQPPPPQYEQHQPPPQYEQQHQPPQQQPPPQYEQQHQPPPQYEQQHQPPQHQPPPQYEQQQQPPAQYEQQQQPPPPPPPPPQYEQQHQPPPPPPQQPPPQYEQHQPHPPQQPPPQYEQHQPPPPQQPPPQYEQHQPPPPQQQPARASNDNDSRPPPPHIGPQDPMDLSDEDFRQVIHDDREEHLFGDESIDDFDDPEEQIFEEWDEHMEDFIPDMLVNFDLGARSDEFFYQDVDQRPTRIRGGFFISGGDGIVDFAVTDPEGNIVLKKSVAESLFHFNTKLPGTYSFIISNHKWLERKQVTFAIGCGNETAPLRSENVNDAVAHVHQLDRMLRDISAESQYLWGRQRGQMQSVDATRHRVLFVATFELVTLVLVWFSQIYYLKKLVSDRRVF